MVRYSQIVSIVMLLSVPQLIVKQIYVKMMKTHILPGGRSTSNSTETASRLKKSVSSSGCNNKLKNSVTSTNCMESSVKAGRVNTSSKSNKKLQWTTSNQSFKGLTETHSQSNLEAAKKAMPRRVEGVVDYQKKSTAVPVKNMKQKAIGHSNQTTMIQSYKVNSRHTEEKENVSEYQKKYAKPVGMDKKLFGVEGQARRTNRQSTNQSLLNFSCMLAPREGEEVSLSQFEIGRKLGKGRFGDVYMARDIRSGIGLAIKMISKKDVKEAGMENQVAQEIKIQLFANHPNILKLYGFFSDHSKIYLLLELGTHGCLFKEIRKKNCCQESLASFYFRQVSGAVRYLHSQNVIHRDIKPENILNCFSVLKLCDFGWAAYSPLYQRQTFCGTLDYVPPEIVTGDFYDERADVWCLGVLCYELCTGKAPFESKADENETYDKILKVDIEFPLYLSGQVADFIGKILNREPTKRMVLDQVESHEWMRRYENEAGRMIPKEIWEHWTRLSRGHD